MSSPSHKDDILEVVPGVHNEQMAESVLEKTTSESAEPVTEAILVSSTSHSLKAGRPGHATLMAPARGHSPIGRSPSAAD